ncbi:MAG: RNA 2',3'-cyclic phosphodiesterase [Acidobacteria bacterium]|nr:MAG: RNA 2',3'-cyclic phosphodiesterase [Acidobacteriota bacterium]
MGLRLFVAFELPAELRRALALEAGKLRPRLPAGRWVKPEAMHLTLAFLGDTDRALVPELDRALGDAFAGHRPFELHLAGAGAFPPRGRLRVAWVGVESDGALEAVQASVAGALRRLLPGAADDKPFRPHLTLARCNPPWPRSALATLEELAGRLPRRPVALTAGTLFASQLKPGGAVHRALSRYPLAGGGG